MKSHLLKHRNLLIFLSWFSIQGMPIIHPVVGKVNNWSYHHIPNPLFRVNVSFPWLLEYPLLIAHRHTTYCGSSAWPRGSQQQMTGCWRTTKTSTHAPPRNTSVRLISSRASCKMFRGAAAVIRVHLLPALLLSVEVYVPRVFLNMFSTGNTQFQSLFPGKPK